MNVDITVTVDEEKTASKRSWMAAHYHYPTVLVYDIQSKRFFDQIAYKPGFPLSSNNMVGGSAYNIPKEFRLEFHLTLAPTAMQSSDKYLNILTVKENGVVYQKRSAIKIGLLDELQAHKTFQLTAKLFSDETNVPAHIVHAKKASFDLTDVARMLHTVCMILSRINLYNAAI